MKPTINKGKKFTPEERLNYYRNMLAKTTSSMKSENYKRGHYPPFQADMLANNVSITTFNNCVVCMNFLSDAYFGAESIRVLENQTYYLGHNAESMHELKERVSAGTELLGNVNTPPVLSLGSIPHFDAAKTMIVPRADQNKFKYCFMSFMNYNLFCLHPDILDSFLNDDVLQGRKGELINQISIYRADPFNLEAYDALYTLMSQLLINESWQPDYRLRYGSWSQHSALPLNIPQ